MKRWLATALVFALCSAVVRADVTLVQTTTVEGGMAAATGQTINPRMTHRIKGLKSRMDMDLPTGAMATITDLTAKQVILLKLTEKTAQVLAGAPPAGTTTTTATVPPASATVKMDAAVTPTGKSQVIDGFKCDEYTFTTTVSLADMTGPNMPPEAAAMMKDVSMAMAGSMWVTRGAPGTAEYLAFQKAMYDSDLATAAMTASGVSMPGMDKMMKAMAKVEGMAYLTEMTMSIEGTGPIVDMMRQMGAMKVITKTNAVNTDPIPDDQFKIPDGFTIVK